MKTLTQELAPLSKRALKAGKPVWTAQELAQLLVGPAHRAATVEQIRKWTAHGIIPKAYYVQRDGVARYRSATLPLVEICTEISGLILQARERGGVDRGEGRKLYHELVPLIPALWATQLSGAEPEVAATMGAPSVFSQDQTVTLKFHGLERAELALRRRIEAQTTA